MLRVDCDLLVVAPRTPPSIPVRSPPLAPSGPSPCSSTPSPRPRVPDSSCPAGDPQRAIPGLDPRARDTQRAPAAPRGPSWGRGDATPGAHRAIRGACVSAQFSESRGASGDRSAVAIGRLWRSNLRATFPGHGRGRTVGPMERARAASSPEPSGPRSALAAGVSAAASSRPCGPASLRGLADRAPSRPRRRPAPARTRASRRSRATRARALPRRVLDLRAVLRGSARGGQRALRCSSPACWSRRARLTSRTSLPPSLRSPDDG